MDCQYNTVTEGAAEGNFFYLNFGFDISSATLVEFEFTTSDGDLLTVTGEVGSDDVPNPEDEENPLALAGQFIEYEWQSTDIPVGSAGNWKAYAYVTIDGVRRGTVSSYCFLVLSKNACGGSC